MAVLSIHVSPEWEPEVYFLLWGQNENQKYIFCYGASSIASGL